MNCRRCVITYVVCATCGSVAPHIALSLDKFKIDFVSLPEADASDERFSTLTRDSSALTIPIAGTSNGYAEFVLKHAAYARVRDHSHVRVCDSVL
jgi:hypothetical protein